MPKRTIHVASACAGNAIEAHLKKLKKASNNPHGFIHILALLIGCVGIASFVNMMKLSIPLASTPGMITLALLAICVAGLVHCIYIDSSTQCTRDAIEVIKRRHRELTAYTTPDTYPDHNKELEYLINEMNSVPIPAAVVANGYEPVLLKLVPHTE